MISEGCSAILKHHRRGLGQVVVSPTPPLVLTPYRLQDPRSSIVAEHVGRDVAFGPENRALPRDEIQSRVALGLGAVTFPLQSRPC